MSVSYPVKPGFKQIFIITILFVSGIATHLMAQQREVVAEKGDGIYRLLTRYGISYGENLEAFIELNKDLLGKENALIAGVKYRLPGSGSGEGSGAAAISEKKVHIALFKGEYADVEIKDSALKGTIYYLISGHGGPDPGSIGKYGDNILCEDEYSYDITLRLARNLIQHGATVYMITRDPDDGIRDQSYLPPDNDEECYPDLPIPAPQLKRLQQRTNAVNKLYGQNRSAFQRVVAIHVDSRSRGENIDIFFYHDKRSNAGKNAATILQQTFYEKYNEHQPGRGYRGTVSTRNLYVVKNTYPVAIYIELGNINHTRDQLRLILNDNRQAVANWLAQGLIADFKSSR